MNKKDNNYNINKLDLEPSKKEAVTTTEGPLLIIAGPGSGKTMTLVERVVYLIAEKSIEPEKIMVSTFTEKAARELITRVSNRILELDVRVNLNEMYIGTMHSIFLRLLEENREHTRLLKNYRMLDDFDQKFFIYNDLSKFEEVEHSSLVLGEHKKSQWSKSENLLKYVNKVHEEILDCDVLIKSNNPEIQAVGRLSKVYDKLLQEENCLDFSTIQTETLNLLENNDEVLKEIQKKIQYIMVDEYQDTNTVQERILLKLMDPNSKNICVVGDDDQGLYRFRGATIRNILEFPDNFKKGECKQVTLSTNYRSHPDIINFYNKWMEEINWSKDGKTFRYEKKIQPEKKDFIVNPSVVKVSSDGELEDWYKEVYSFITELKKKSILEDYNQVALLCKSVKADRVIGLAHYLEEKGINIFSPRSNLFFDREEIQLLMGAFIFIFPDLFEKLKWNKNAHLNIWEYYELCKELFANEIRKDKEKHKLLLAWCNGKAKTHLNYDKKNMHADYGLSALLYELLQFPMFSKYLDVDLNEKVYNLRSAYNIALLSKLLNKVEYYYNITVLTSKYYVKTLRDVFNRFFRFLIDGGIEEYEDFEEYAPSGCISVMTIHQSKGLEFPVVLVDSLNLVPRKQYSDIDVVLQDKYYHKPPFEPIEETKNYDFWRLFYTAFSRAQNVLVLTGKESEGRGLARLPSKYFAPLYNEVISWRDKSFNINKLDLETVKPVNIKHEYSFTSDILLYENCPRQYKFFKELEFSPVRSAATMFGILVHQTIEDIHKNILNGNEKKVNDKNITDWFNMNYTGLIKQFHSYLGEGQKKAALMQAINYKERHKHEWDMLKEAEVDVSLVKDDYILKGVIDLIKGKKETVEIIDFKSERHKPDVNNIGDREKLDRYKRQLEIYSHIVEERTGYEVSRMHLYYTGEESGNPYITYDRDKKNIDSTVNEFDKVVDHIENKNYDMSNIKMCEKLCSNCDIRYYCHFQ
ncbi:ATP-dependent DNA helicase [Spirochaetota bacterium]